MRKQKPRLWKSYCDQIAKEKQSKSFNSLTFFTRWMQLQPLKIYLLPRARHLLCTGSHITSAVRACIAAFLGTFQPVSLSENNRQAGRQAGSPGGWEDISNSYPTQWGLRKSPSLPSPRSTIWRAQSYARYFRAGNCSSPRWLASWGRARWILAKAQAKQILILTKQLLLHFLPGLDYLYSSFLYQTFRCCPMSFFPQCVLC